MGWDILIRWVTISFKLLSYHRSIDRFDSSPRALSYLPHLVQTFQFDPNQNHRCESFPGLSGPNSQTLVLRKEVVSVWFQIEPWFGFFLVWKHLFRWVRLSDQLQDVLAGYHWNRIKEKHRNKTKWTAVADSETFQLSSGPKTLNFPRPMITHTFFTQQLARCVEVWKDLNFSLRLSCFSLYTTTSFTFCVNSQVHYHEYLNVCVIILICMIHCISLLSIRAGCPFRTWTILHVDIVRQKC